MNLKFSPTRKAWLGAALSAGITQAKQTIQAGHFTIGQLVFSFGVGVAMYAGIYIVPNSPSTGA